MIGNYIGIVLSLLANVVILGALIGLVGAIALIIIDLIIGF